MRSKWAWRNGVAAAILALATPLWGVDGQAVVVRDFSKGLQTTFDSTLIDDGASPDLVNVDVENGSIAKRGGSIAVSSSSLGGYGADVRFVYEYIETDGDRWVISAASATIFKSNDGGVNNSVLTSTHGFTTSSEYCAVTAFGTTRLTDGTTNWITWNGTSVGVSTTAPHGDTCAFFGDRVWTSVGSTLYATNIDDVEDWTVTASSGDADAIEQPVRFNDGQGITCLRPFKDRLLVYKAKSLDAYVRQDDGISYVLEPISNHIGTSHCNSVVEREGDVVFLGPDAFYKYEPGTASYKGYSGSVSRISDLIKPTVASIQQLDVNSVFWSATDDLAADFSLFTSSSNVSIIGDSVYLSTDNTNHTNNSFETGSEACGSGEIATGWVYAGGNTFTCLSTESPKSGSKDTQFIASALVSGSDVFTDFHVEVLDASGVLLAAFSNDYPSMGGTYVQFTKSLSAYAGRFIKLKFEGTSNGLEYSATSKDAFLCSGGNMTYWARTASVSPSGQSILFDLIEGGRSTTYTGTLTSRAMDTATSSPTWITSLASYTENGHSVTFQTQVSTDGATWDAAVSWTPGNPPASASKRWIRYVVTLSTGGTTNGTALPHVDSVSLRANLSGGTQAPVWSEYHLGSYITSVATTSSTGNDGLLIYDRNSAWTAYDHDFYSMRRLASGAILGGSNSDGKIYRFRDSSLANDNGASISWYWRSKDFDFGLPLTDKVMLRYYVTADYSADSDATFAYGVNRGSTTSKTLDLDLYTGFFRDVVRPASITYSKGLQHFFRISGSGVDESCVIRSVTMKPRSEVDP